MKLSGVVQVAACLLFSCVVGYTEQNSRSEEDRIWGDFSASFNPLSERGEYDRARKVAQKAYEEALEKLGEGHRTTASIQANLADCHFYLGQYPEAVTHYEQALPVLKRHLATYDPALAKTMANLGSSYIELGQHARAEPLLRKALMKFELKLGFENYWVGYVRRLLYYVYASQEKFEEARSQMEIALRIFDKAFGENNAAVDGDRLSLGTTYCQLNEFGKAIQLFESLAERGSLGAQYNLGVIYKDGTGVPRDFDKAMLWFRKAADGGFAPAKRLVEQLGTGLPVVPTVEETSRRTHFSLARGYLGVLSNLAMIEVVQNAPKIKLSMQIDGRSVAINEKNAKAIHDAFQKRLKVYDQVIGTREYPDIADTYGVESDGPCETKEQRLIRELFSSGSHREDILRLVPEVEIRQEGFKVELIMRVPFEDELREVVFKGVVIGNAVVFEVPNVNFHLWGNVKDEAIHLRLDLNEVKRESSFDHAMNVHLPKDKRKELEDLSATRYGDCSILLRRI